MLGAGPKILCLVPKRSSPGDFALRIDFAKYIRVSKVGFVQPPWGGVLFVALRGLIEICLYSAIFRF